MGKITSTRYVLAVQNLETSVKFYTEKMGFQVLFEINGWCHLGRGPFIVMLGECANELAASKLGDHSYMAYAEVENADALYEEYKLNGIEISKHLTTEPWGMKEFAIQTIDGHRIMFGQSIVEPRG